jgi:hypothetical protein
VDHCCQNHQEETLKFKTFVFNSNVGKFGYQSKDFRVKPIEVLNGNDRLLIDNDGYEIRIVANEEQIDDVQDNLLEELEESILNLSFSPPAKKVKCYSEDDNAREDIIRGRKNPPRLHTRCSGGNEKKWKP